MPPSLTALLLLADSRLPAGGHAHSGGLEAAVAAGRVHDVSTLDAFLRGRLATAGLVAAAFAAAAGAGSAVDDLDAALDARTPSATQRRISRAQGRSLLRAGRALWTVAPSRVDPHQPVALGLVGAAAGLSPGQVAGVAAYQTVAGPASAAVRLLGLDPYEVHALLARTAAACDDIADRGVAAARGPVEDLPAASAPLLDITAEHHATWEVRLFAS